MDAEGDLMETIKACRTCGIHYVAPSQHQLKHLFQPAMEHSEIMLIRLELAQWNVEVTENDGFPQYVCSSCIHKFERVFELRTSCINAQNELRKFYNMPNGNLANIKVKTELQDTYEEQPMCDFIYVDDLSDTEYDGATPFNIPHVPIKEEVIEAATIPMEETQQAANLVESASSVVRTSAIQQPQSESIASSPTVLPSAIEQVECKLCQHLSPSQEEHKEHLHRAHEIKDMECYICGKQFKNSTSARLKFHLKWHTLNKHIKCTLCGFVCNSKDALQEHKRANHGKIKCKICGKGVLAKKMKSHLRQHEILPRYNCEYCAAAFDAEDAREHHIWQIHANEDNNVTYSMGTSTATAANEHEINENLLNAQHEDEMMYEEGPQDNLIDYKFLCAHCEQRFMQQIELEIHANEEHRPKTTLANVQTQNLVNENLAMAPPEEMENMEHTNITVFEDYDNDTETDIHLPTNDLPPMMASDSEQNRTQTEDLPNDMYEHSEPSPEYHTETATSNSSDEEESADTDSANITISNLPAYDDNNLNTFACAKCAETFATIEQLRQHHKQHLAAVAADDEQQKITASKSKFKCNLCGKLFGLKFSLNRHVMKHKHAPL